LENVNNQTVDIVTFHPRAVYLFLVLESLSDQSR